MERHVNDRYRLIEPIGEGGMGVVWRAHDELLDRTVAIKEVRYTGVGEDKRAELNRRTIREARAAGRLDHPSVVVIHDVIEEDGRPWIVMQLVRSRSLAEVVREHGPLSVDRVALIGARVLDALRAAHATGVLHRDVKPENVLLADDGRVVLTDFGIATLETETALTATGGLVGTPAYMPPERLNGLPARPESDLWSLGATLHAAVEGHPPFQRDSWAATVAAVLRDAPEPPRRAGPLAPVISGLLRRDPEARMSAAEAFARLHATAAPAYPAQAPPVFPAQTPPAFPGQAPPVPASYDPAPYTPAWDVSTRPPAAGRAPGGHGPAPRLPEPREVSTFAGPPIPVRRRSPLVWILPSALAVAVLAAGGTVLALRGPATPSAAPTPAPSATRPSPRPSAKPTPAKATVPEGWRVLRNTTGGFTLAVPEGWTARRTPGRASIRVTGPGSPGALIVEWTTPATPDPDPSRAWRNLEAEIERKGEFDGYRRLAIRPLTYLGVAAADWEFTRVREGATVHVVNRGFRWRDGRHFALYWEAPEAVWTRDRHFFDTFVRTFRP
ncbi:protein kinase [Nonomuraea sp. NPDC046570]|uniref:serine/threonine-protein kinase n=1 Tax=Nonomuraea sp. NPDC046570 TaxID=3155255 RepID=UPI0033D67A54